LELEVSTLRFIFVWKLGTTLHGPGALVDVSAVFNLLTVSVQTTVYFPLFIFIQLYKFSIVDKSEHPQALSRQNLFM
jgi:hypothetical protein